MYAIEIGDIFADRFRIEAELGHGGMGSVYKAKQIVLNRDVALKVIAPQFSKNPMFCELFDREASTMAMLTHPNIVAIIDRSPPAAINVSTLPLRAAPSSASSIRWLALQFVDGSSLTGLVKRIPARGRLPVEHAARAVHDVLLGLEYAHGKSVVHQDIKPDNIFLAKDTGQVLLGDFGLAKVRAGTVAVSVLKGTPNYTAPELMQGAPPSPQSDLWSVGAMFWELLTGQLLYGGSSFEECLFSITTKDLPPLAAFGVAVPPGVEQVLRGLLAKSRSARYLSASDALRDLAPFVGDLPTFRRFIRGTFGLVEPSHGHSSSKPFRATTGAIANGQIGAARRTHAKQGRGLLLAIAASALVAGGATAVIVGNSSRGTSAQMGPDTHEGRSDTAQPAATRAPSQPVNLPDTPAQVAAQPLPAAPVLTTAVVTITVTPADATLAIDGRALEGTGSRRLQGVELHKRLSVHAERAEYLPYDGTIPVDSADVLVPVQLAAAPVRPSSGARPPSRQEGPLVITPGGVAGHHRGEGPAVVTPR